MKFSVLINKSNELLQNKILIRLILGTPEWDGKIRNLLIDILRQKPVREAAIDTLKGYLTASFSEEKVASALGRELHSKSNKDFIRQLLARELTKFIVESKGLDGLLQSELFVSSAEKKS